MTNVGMPWVVLGLLVACSATLPEPTRVHVEAMRARDPDVDLASLRRGRELYVARCAQCHVLRDPAQLEPEAWPAEIDSMRTRHGVALQDDEASDIARYLAAVSQLAHREGDTTGG